MESYRRTAAKKQKRLTYLCLGSFIGLLLAVGLSFLAAGDVCRVETKLLFVSSDNRRSAAETLARELEILQDSNLLLTLSQRLSERAGNYSTIEHSSSANNWDIEATSCELADSGQCVFPDELSNSTDFIRWISSNLTVERKPTTGAAIARVTLSGGDPAFLKAVLNNYVRCYADYRRSMEEETAPLVPASNQRNPLLDSIVDQLEKADLQRKECDLALQLIDSRHGVFSGFVPDSQMNGVPSLGYFQKRIVEIEINKRRLNVQFTSNSHEIKILDNEIQQIRSAMRECLAEHIVFLQKNRELLLAQKRDLEKKPLSGGPRLKRPCGGKMPNGDSRFYLTDTLQLIQDKPVVCRKPIPVKTSDLKNGLLALVSAPFNSEEFRFLFCSHSDPFRDRVSSASDKKNAIAEAGRHQRQLEAGGTMVTYSDSDWR